MPGTSKITKAYMVRLPMDVGKRVESNAAKNGSSVSEYLRKMVTTQVMRKR